MAFFHEYWSNLQLGKLQEELDVTAQDIATAQDDSESSRRQLMELTRIFKLEAVEDVKRAAAGILRSYQLEVDQLSNRSKRAEAAFLELYKKVIDMPDPLVHVAELEKRSERVAELDLESAHLRDALAEATAELAEGKDSELTVRELQKTVSAYEKDIDETVQKIVEERESELRRDWERREKELQELVAISTKKVSDLEKQKREVDKVLAETQAELMDSRAGLEERKMAQSSEQDMTMEDLERATMRCETLERENEQLQTKLKELNSLGVAKPELFGGLEDEMEAKDKQIAQLLEDLRQAKASSTGLAQEKDHKIESLEKDLEAQMLVSQGLEQELSLLGDYYRIKEELKMLKSAELGGWWNGEEEPEGSKPGGSVGSGQTNNSLNSLLREKVKALERDNTAVRRENRTLQGEVTTARADQSRLTKEGESTREKLRKLEDELVRIKPEAQLEKDPQDPVTDFFGSPALLPEVSTPQPNLIAILKSQRDHLKQKVDDSERASMEIQESKSKLEAEIDRTRTDNVRLYEKIKFLESYTSGKARPDDNVMERYSGQYESSMDPFTRFHQQESHKRYQALKPHEKVTLGIGRMVLRSASARAIFAIYLFILHCLVFFVLYHIAHTATCQRDAAADCARRFAEHMQAVHGNAAGHSHVGDAH